VASKHRTGHLYFRTVEPFRTGGPRPEFGAALRRGIGLRCARCGRGSVYRSVWHMNRACPECGLPYYREPGYFVGAMMVNYAATVFIIIAAYLVTRKLPPMWSASPEKKITVWLAAATCISILLVPLARSVWIAVDYWVEPWTAEERS
jgi:uncharacterized protein (DUF983 family)